MADIVELDPELIRWYMDHYSLTEHDARWRAAEGRWRRSQLPQPGGNPRYSDLVAPAYRGDVPWFEDAYTSAYKELLREAGDVTVDGGYTDFLLLAGVARLGREGLPIVNVAEGVDAARYNKAISTACMSCPPRHHIWVRVDDRGGVRARGTAVLRFRLLELIDAVINLDSATAQLVAKQAVSAALEGHAGEVIATRISQATGLEAAHVAIMAILYGCVAFAKALGAATVALQPLDGQVVTAMAKRRRPGREEEIAAWVDEDSRARRTGAKGRAYRPVDPEELSASLRRLSDAGVTKLTSLVRGYELTSELHLEVPPAPRVARS